MGYNNHLKCIGFLHQKKQDWTNVKIIVFDVPQSAEYPYSKRLQILQQSLECFKHIILIHFNSGIPSNHSILEVVSPIVCQGRQHLETYFNKLCLTPKSPQSEGVILRNPSSWYFEKNSFLKKEVN